MRQKSERVIFVRLFIIYFFFVKKLGEALFISVCQMRTILCLKLEDIIGFVFLLIQLIETRFITRLPGFISLVWHFSPILMINAALYCNSGPSVYQFSHLIANRDLFLALWWAAYINWIKLGWKASMSISVSYISWIIVRLKNLND